MWSAFRVGVKHICLYTGVRRPPPLLLLLTPTAFCFQAAMQSMAADDDEDVEAVFMVLGAWCSLTRERRVVRPYFSRARRSIEGLNESECHTNFRFRKEQLPILKSALGFPDELVAGNGLRFTGEECMLFMLRRMRCVIRPYSYHIGLTPPKLPRAEGTLRRTYFRSTKLLPNQKRSTKFHVGVGGCCVNRVCERRSVCRRSCSNLTA